jgi:hypothetical protein
MPGWPYTRPAPSRSSFWRRGSRSIPRKPLIGTEARTSVCAKAPFSTTFDDRRTFVGRRVDQPRPRWRVRPESSPHRQLCPPRGALKASEAVWGDEVQKSRNSRKEDTNDTKTSGDLRATLWASADKLRGNMDAAEYKHVALGLIFLKYISDRFEERRAEALADPEEVDLADERDLYVGDNVFWVPENARWDHLKANATSTDPTIGALIDRAMLDLEVENASLKGLLTKNYARPELDQIKLGEVIKLFSDLTFQDEHHWQDMLGRVYEYFLGQFAIAEGKQERSLREPRKANDRWPKRREVPQRPTKLVIPTSTPSLPADHPPSAKLSVV